MKVYINKSDVPNYVNGEIPSKVIDYIVKKQISYEARCKDLYDRYKCADIPVKIEDDKIKVKANYCKYIVDIIKGYYLSEPIKYDNNDIKKKDESSKISMVPTVKAKLDKKDGSLVRHTPIDKALEKEIDISPIIDVYHRQNISDIDDKNGKNLGIFGEACELIYASTDEKPIPKSAAYKPYSIVLVQDNTVEHNDLFAMLIDKRERINNEQYYAVSIYTEKVQQDYESEDISKTDYTYSRVGEPIYHSFGAVPVICYENNEERQGDFEQVISLIDARNELLSDRLTDKKAFVDAVLAVYGAVLDKSAKEQIKKEGILDGLPEDAKMEYLQKTFDENSLKVLDDTLIMEIHKQTLTPDMTDEKFSGNASGVALRLKLLALNILVKSKMRAMETGLKKRWEIYYNFLSQKNITPVSIDDVDIVFTVSMPIDEQQTVDIVVKLKDSGLVDDQTLLSLLWFIKDPAEALENMKQQKEENQKAYLDSFGRQDLTKRTDE